MRKSGDLTKKYCWEMSIYINDKIISQNKYKTIRDIADELDLSYNVVSEMIMGRKKNRKGKFEPQYLFTRL
mgnify:CR=1 FL=1